MGAREGLPGTEFSDRGQHISGGAFHPLERCVLEPLLLEALAHVEVAEHRAIVPIGGLVNDDLEVLDRRGFELLSDTDLHGLGGLADLEQASMRCVVDRVGVDPEAGVWLLGEELGLRLRHRRSR